MRRATVLATAVLALGTLGAPAMAVAPGDVPDQGAAATDRISGEDRYDTAALTALRAYPDGAETVIVATGEKFPDALAASYLSGGVDAPILLTERTEIPSFTLDAMDELSPSQVFVMGETDAIAAEVVDQLRDRVGDDNVDVIGGATRRETAAMIARAGGEVGTAPNLTNPDGEALKTAIVARADEFPDALASGPLALAGRHPILLTDTDDLPQVTIDALTDADLGIEQVIVTGGPVAVSAEVEDEIRDLDGITSVARVDGENRTETAVELAELTRTTLGWDGSEVALARGDNFPDALSFAPLAVQQQASLFLSRTPETIEGDTFAGMQALCGATENLTITGGPIAISAEAAGEAKLATICADHVFPISGDQEVAEGDTDAAGTGWVTVEGDTVCTTYDVEGLEAQADASHLHNAVAGSDGPIVQDLGAPNVNGFLATCDVNADVADGITAEPAAFYVNIHTPEFALGAARGQLDGTQDNRTTLEGETEVADDGTFVDAPAAGTAQVDLFIGEGELCYELDVSGLESPVDLAIAGGFHIHEGAVNANGPIVVELPQSQSATDYTTSDCVEVAQAQLDDIVDNPQDYYFNLHTVDNPAGALRGQLGADAEFHVYGAAENDDDGTIPGGDADVQFDQGQDGLIGDARVFFADETTVCVDLEMPDGSDPLTGAHIHQGDIDENGPVLIAFADLVGQEDGITCASPDDAATAAATVAAIAENPTAHYLNAHTDAFPNGAARNQLAAELTTELTGAAEVADGETGAGDLTAQGSAKAYQASEANPDVVCGEFHVEGADPLTAAHIHEAPAGANGDVVVTIADGLAADATHAFGCQTNVDETTAGDIFTTPADYYVNVHSEAFPAGAVRGQLG